MFLETILIFIFWEQFLKNVLSCFSGIKFCWELKYVKQFSWFILHEVVHLYMMQKFSKYSPFFLIIA